MKSDALEGLSLFYALAAKALRYVILTRQWAMHPRFTVEVLNAGQISTYALEGLYLSFFMQYSSRLPQCGRSN